MPARAGKAPGATGLACGRRTGARRERREDIEAGDGAARGGDDLLAFVRRFADREAFAVEEDLGDGYVRLHITEAERRQALQDIRCVEDVVRELVRNARDAGAGRIYVTFQKEKGRWRNITVLDDGQGIPEKMRRRIFEARVTSKVRDVVQDHLGVHGRGMALYSIRQVVDDIRLIRSREESGTIMQVRMDTAKLAEKKDQSSFPSLEMGEKGETVIAAGPHNVPRVLAEFALEPHSPRIYLGSNAEVLATLYRHAQSLRRAWAAGERSGGEPLWFDLGDEREGRQLHAYSARELGVAVSERNAFRILQGEIRHLLSVNRLLGASLGGEPAKRQHLQRSRGEAWSEQLARRLSPEDGAALADKVREAFAPIGERYYLRAGDAQVRRSKDRLIISLGLHEAEES